MPSPAAGSPADRVAVVIPAYRVTRHVMGVIAAIGPECERIYVVDDACPDGSGGLVERECRDPRVVVVHNPVNRGVGGAVLAGYRRAIDEGMDVIVKIDGDGQMDPALIQGFVQPIRSGLADYTKGNRFFDIRSMGRMPLVRRVGNLALSFMSKASSGYWDIFDPTNGYTAINARVADMLPFDSIEERYFFETDMLFRLNTLRAVVLDVPMQARYGDETSHLKVSRAIAEFFLKHMRNLGKRIVYNYFLRDLSIASFELLTGLAMMLFGIIFGGWHWYHSMASGTMASPGTVMIPTVALLMGIQLVLAFLAYDIAAVPRTPLHVRLVPGRHWRSVP
jgi:dolichol-phosphate mannosyltransferase